MAASVLRGFLMGKTIKNNQKQNGFHLKMELNGPRREPLRQRQQLISKSSQSALAPP